VIFKTATADISLDKVLQRVEHADDVLVSYYGSAGYLHAVKESVVQLLTTGSGVCPQCPVEVSFVVYNNRKVVQMRMNRSAPLFCKHIQKYYPL